MKKDEKEKKTYKSDWNKEKKILMVKLRYA